jgi:predicted Fe-Mo cluster-binding NifX family protein
MGVDAVITMNIGPKAFATFKSADVRVFQAKPGTVGETVDQFQAGQLVEFAGPNVEEYWTHPKR